MARSRFVHMGDLGRYNENLELFYEGRLADNFKVCGDEETGGGSPDSSRR